jgi:hypothetical protein
MRDHTKGLAFDQEGNLFSCNHPLSLEEEEQMGKVAERTADQIMGGEEDLRYYVAQCERKDNEPASLEMKIARHLEEKPTDITFDSEGNLIYVAGHNVAKMSFGLFGADEPESILNLEAQFPQAQNSTGVCFDKAGNLYIGMTNPYARAGGSVVKVDPAGNATTFAERLQLPADIVADYDGNIYISDMTANRVYRVKADRKDSRTPFRPPKKIRARKPAPATPTPQETDQQETIPATEPEPAPQEKATPAIEPDAPPAEETTTDQAQSEDDEPAASPTEEFLNCAKDGDDVAVAEFLDDGMYPDVKDHNRRTALMLAAFEGHDEVVEILLNRGANLRARDVDGWTAIIYAAYGGQVETVRFLIGAGANVNDRVRSGQSVLTIAEQKGHDDVVYMLEQAGATR